MNLCFLSLNISGSSGRRCIFLRVQDASQEVTQVFLQLSGLYDMIENAQFICALRKPGTCAKVMCVFSKCLISLDRDPKATQRSPDFNYDFSQLEMF